jgi:hypothetical protein
VVGAGGEYGGAVSASPESLFHIGRVYIKWYTLTTVIITMMGETTPDPDNPPKEGKHV